MFRLSFVKVSIFTGIFNSQMKTNEAASLIDSFAMKAVVYMNNMAYLAFTIVAKCYFAATFFAIASASRFKSFSVIYNDFNPAIIALPISCHIL
jgi:hypothetical protein